MILARSGLDRLKPYSSEETLYPVKLDANEMPDQAAVFANDVISRVLAQTALNRYPDITAFGLRQQLAGQLGLTAEQVVIGNGSSELLGAICYAFGGKERRMIYPTPSFSMYGVYVRLSDSEPVPVTLDENFCLSPEAVVGKAQAANASLVILCNPNNPTGNVTSQQAIEYIAANVSCPVVVDEAYYEFYGQSSQNLLDQYQNLIITRTFSKAYGLAGARIGYMLAAPELASLVSKVLLPYHVNAFSLAAAGVLLENREQVMNNVQQIIAERDRLSKVLKECGKLTVFPSETNFLLLRSARAEELVKALAAKGIGIRNFSHYPGLSDCIRITIGDKQENDQLAAAIRCFFTEDDGNG